jgi:hypothetical protein
MTLRAQRFGNIFILIILLPFCEGHYNSSSGQSLNYKEIFGEDWQKAEKFLSENKLWMKPAAEKLGIPYEVAEAVVFPELVRYSALRDKIEITLLKALYINLGQDYANFSIGQFQVKPSFAEKVREFAASSPGRKIKNLFKRDYEKDNIRDFRSSMVADLEDPVSEWNYVLAFFLISDKRFELKGREVESKIIFLATAYNYGFYRTKDEIEKMTGRKFFNTKLFSDYNYSYSDIALFRYKQINPKK